MTPRRPAGSTCTATRPPRSCRKLGVQRALGLPECATPPEEVYELAKRRGMDFVTITDHDTIDGALEIADRPDVFISEELTAWFRGEPQAVHVLCYGITPDDHDWLQAHSRRRRGRAPSTCTSSEIACALAHPFYAVEAPLHAAPPPPPRRSSSRSGRRATARARAELNTPAAVYIETHGGTGVGGSDDHAGVDIGRTLTETPARRDAGASSSATSAPGDATPRGEQGSAAKWAHAAMALAVRALGRGDGAARARPARRADDGRARDERGRRAPRRDRRRPRPRRRARAAARLARRGRPRPRRRRELLALMQADDFSHADLFRRARRAHERKLARRGRRRSWPPRPAAATCGAAARGLFDACVAAIPYAPAAAFLGREKGKLVAPRGRAAARRARRRRASAACTA